MARNLYFSEKVRSEMDMYENLVIEALKIYGQDVYYLPRDLVNEDELLGADPTSRFPTSHKIEMYIENVEGFDGEGDLFTRFGVEIRDEVTLVVARSRFATQVRRPDNDIVADRPVEGDLVYIPLTNKMFEIRHVEHEQPFYQIENLPVFKLRCTLFEYSGEDFDNQIADIQAIEVDGSYQYKICTIAPKPAVAEAIVTGMYVDSNYMNLNYVQRGLKISGITLVDSGNYFTTVPTIQFVGGGDSSNPIPLGDSASATATIDSTGSVSSITLIDSGNGYMTPPTIQFIGGSSVDSNYAVGDTVTQILAGGVTISGEIQKIHLDSAGDSSRCFYLSHVGADDGKYHSFVTGTNTNIGSYAASTGTLINSTNNGITGLVIKSVSEDNKISNTEQNATFSDFSDDFLDFSEDNPFGDPENQ